jgi:RNA polymerase sigma factor (sigma-70 family)
VVGGKKSGTVIEAERAALFLALSHVPKRALARAITPQHIDRRDLLSEANKALLETIIRHEKKPFLDLERLSSVRCKGAIRDALRGASMLQGASRHGVRAQTVSTESLDFSFVGVVYEPVLILGKIRRAIEALSERDRQVLIGRAVYDLEVATLAKKYGISTARISQIYTASIRKIREALATD